MRHGGYPPVGLPAGFGVAGFKTSEIYNGPTPHEIAIPKTPLSFDSQVFFVPTIGLMEYYNGVHHQLTDEALSAVPADATEFHSAEVTTEIFVRNSGEKPFLIWGEDKGPRRPNFPQRHVDEIVAFDPVSQKEIMRKPLVGIFSTGIHPDRGF